MAAAPPPDNPNYGQTLTKGVKYLKINRLDKDGEDYGNKLVLADSIKINYPDIGAVEYSILTTQQQGDSYLMGVVPQENTSSLNNIKDWDVSLVKAPLSETMNPFDVVVFNNDNQGGMTVIGGNGGGYYNPTTDLYSFNLGNVPLSVTSSVSVTSVVGSPIYISVLIPSSSVNAWVEGLPSNLWEIYGVQALNVIPINAGNAFYTVKSSLNDNFGGDFYIGGVCVAFAGSSLTLLQVYEEINQGTPAYDSPDEALLNIYPEVENFEYSDYNAIFGNASTPQFSGVYQDVDYASNGLIPINFDLIISGSARKAQIQDSNYTQTGWSNGRYNGSKNSSIDFNQ